MFGIRTNSRTAANWLDDVLGDRRVEGEAEPNFSVVIGETGKLGKRYHMVYKESTAVVRTFDLELLADVLLAEIDALTCPLRRDAAYLEAALVQLNGLNALVPPDFVESLDEVGRRTAKAGLALPTSSFTAVDLERAQAIPSPRAHSVVPDAGARLAQKLASEPGGVRRVRLEQPAPVDVICTMGAWTGEEIRPVSRAHAVYTLAALTTNLAALGGSVLDTLDRLAAGAKCFEVAGGRPQQILERVTTVLTPQLKELV